MNTPDAAFGADEDAFERSLEKRLLSACEIIKGAGELAKALYHDRRSLSVDSKGAHDWVSEADTLTEAMIFERIRLAYPNDHILGEEKGLFATDAAAPLWVVDPIDGTTCFINGIPQWCITLAVVLSGVVHIGVVYDPVAGDLYHAVRGKGAWCNAKPMKVSQASTLSDGLVSVGMSLQLGPETPAKLIGYLASQGGMHTRIGSCGLGLAYVAQGRLIGLYEPLIHAWDSWAGQLLVTEAGGVTLERHQGALIDRPGPCIVSAPRVWSSLSWLVEE